ncbi:mucin-5AC isoform X4 [Bombina bombina]|uniref:mucin-5AC isoform X4 n=1 Tax=Bombina bombina TaxID=8345 RepID=UPI00235AEDFB|nr:mucin-5AC isoform X4 [Bombina bombina]
MCTECSKWLTGPTQPAAMTKYLLLLYAVILGSASQPDPSTTIAGKVSQPDSSTTGAAAISQPDSSTTGVTGQIYKHPTTTAIMDNHSSSNRAFHTTVKLPSGITSAITDSVTTERATLQLTSKLKPIISTAIPDIVTTERATLQLTSKLKPIISTAIPDIVTTEKATLQLTSKLKPIISTAIPDIVTTERATLQSTSKLKPIISTATTSDRTLHATVKIQESINSATMDHNQDLNLTNKLQSNKSTAFISNPKIKYLDISNNQVQLSCFSESGSLPIVYSIYNKKELLQEEKSYLRQPTNFTITLTPGVQVELMCQAKNSDGVKKTYLSPIRSNKEAEIDTSKNEDKVEDDSSPNYIIALDRILTSVDPISQQKNIFVLIFSLSFIFCMLIVLGTINYFRKRCARMTKKSSLIH